MKPETLKTTLQTKASALGFDVCRVTGANLPSQYGENLKSFVEYGRHASMSWMENTLERRVSPTAMWCLGLI